MQKYICNKIYFLLNAKISLKNLREKIKIPHTHKFNLQLKLKCNKLPCIWKEIKYNKRDI